MKQINKIEKLPGLRLEPRDLRSGAGLFNHYTTNCWNCKEIIHNITFSRDGWPREGWPNAVCR